jgi:chaperone modulatory protein CbpM
MRRLERDFDAVPELAALVVDLIEELDAVRARLRRAGLE